MVSFSNLYRICYNIASIYVLVFWLCGMWDLVPQPGIEPKPPALNGRVLTTGPPGKSQQSPLFLVSVSLLTTNSKILEHNLAFKAQGQDLHPPHAPHNPPHPQATATQSISLSLLNKDPPQQGPSHWLFPGPGAPVPGFNDSLFLSIRYRFQCHLFTGLPSHSLSYLLTQLLTWHL